MDWLLIVAIVVAFLILLVAGVYLIVHFQHPDDKNEAWFPKIVVLLGFILAGSTVLLLPLDVANHSNYPGEYFWWFTAVYIVLTCLNRNFGTA